jgi:hypothetical protein
VHPMERSSSDGIGAASRKIQIPSMLSPGKNPRQYVRVAPKPHRPIAQRASSNSQVERLSCHHDPPVTSETFQYDLDPHTQPAGDLLHVPRRPPVIAKPKSQSNSLAAENSAPAFRWYVRVQSISDPDLRTKYLKPAQYSHDVPLRRKRRVRRRRPATVPNWQLDSQTRGLCVASRLSTSRRSQNHFMHQPSRWRCPKIRCVNQSGNSANCVPKQRVRRVLHTECRHVST